MSELSNNALFKIAVDRIKSLFNEKDLIKSADLLCLPGDNIDTRVDITTEDGYVIGYVNITMVTFQKPMKPITTMVSKNEYKLPGSK